MPQDESPEAVMAAYAERINLHRFAAVAPLIAEDAVFWFSDGSHAGLPAIRAAFEATWAALAGERYRIEGLDWIARGAEAAACTYRFRWRATVEGAPRDGAGRGTTVLRRGAAGWRIVHEHLSGLPDEPGGDAARRRLRPRESS